MKSTPAARPTRSRYKGRPTILGHLSYRDVAKRAKIHHTYVGMIFRGERMPGPAVLFRLAAVLGMTMEQLYGRLAVAGKGRQAGRAGQAGRAKGRRVA